MSAPDAITMVEVVFPGQTNHHGTDSVDPRWR